jgi:hypothetical protein
MRYYIIVLYIQTGVRAPRRTCTYILYRYEYRGWVYVRVRRHNDIYASYLYFL